MSKEMPRSLSRAMLGASVLAIAMAAQSASAQSCPGVGGEVCAITVTGSSQSVSTQGATQIVNSGTGTTITQTSNAYLLIENQAGASISGLTLLTHNGPTADGLTGTTLVNRGTITGDAVFASGGVFVNDGGSVTGNLTASDQSVPANLINSFTFINRSAATSTGVTGTINAGNGLDFYIQSFAATGSHALSALPTSFEVGGVEALGATTTVTITNGTEGHANDGLAIWGNGNIVNRAIINDMSFAGTGLTSQVIAAIPKRAVTYSGEVGGISTLLVPVDGGSPQRIAYGGSLSSFTNEGEINGDLLLRTASFVNSNKINVQSNQPGTIIFGAKNQDFSFTNTGVVTMTNMGVRPNALIDTAIGLVSAIDTTTRAAVNISNSGQIGGGLSFYGVATDFVFDNSGTISMAGNPNEIDRAATLELGTFEGALDPEQELAANTVTITNRSTGTLDGGIEAEVRTRTFAFTNAGLITADANDLGAAAVELSVEDYADAAGNEDVIDAETASFANTGTIDGNVELEFEASSITINNSGSIARQLTTDGHPLFPDGYSGLELDQETTLGAIVQFTNSGAISTADYAGAGVAIEVEAGSLDSGVAGAETAAANVTVVNSGTIQASGGNYLVPGGFIGMPQNQLLLDLAVGLLVNTDAEGESTISITNAANALIDARGAGHIGFPTGTQLIQGQADNAGGIGVAARAGRVTIVNNGTIRGAPGSSLTTPTGAVLVPNADADVDFEGLIGGAIDTFSGTDDVTNAATGVIEGGIALRTGNDTLKNYGSITGNVSLGGGDDTFIQGIRATFTGTADGGAGSDTLLIDITGGGTLNEALYAQFVNFETFSLTGTGAINSEGPLPVETVDVQGGSLEVGAGSVIQTQGETAITGSSQAETLNIAGTVLGNVALGGGNNQLTNTGTIQGNITAGSDSDVVENAGTIEGNVDLGGGNDRFVLGAGATVTGATGGDGIDTLAASFSGTYEAPSVLDDAQFISFEAVEANGGTAVVTNSLTTGSITVNDGRIIGQAGSVITAGSVQVADNATFGSAGQVIGDIAVSGTLSPGSSPGTMVVTGNVALASGSETLFELTPTVSDQLLISGTLTIASGSTLTLTGERPLTPGSSYDLIVADGGITGSFTTVTKPATILGFVAQRGNRIQLLGQFANSGAFSANAQASIDYVNGVLVAGQGSAALLNALPSLLTAQGATSAAAFEQLTPEAYASAVQIGIEHGLTIADMARTRRTALGAGGQGAYGWAQGIGNWRNLDASAAAGTAKADIRTTGVVGGIGIASEMAEVGAFIGRLDSRQTLAGRGARTDADGIFGGVYGDLKFGQAGLHALIAYDSAEADTRRSVLGSTATGNFDVGGWTADLSADYRTALSNSWSLQPRVGLTYVRVERDGVTEAGAGAFALVVDKGSLDAWFADAGVTIAGDVDLGGTKARPFASIGVRHQLGGDEVAATARLTGTTAGALTVAGAARSDTVAQLGAGIGLDLTSRLQLFGGYNAELAGKSNRYNVTGGVSFKF